MNVRNGYPPRSREKVLEKKEERTAISEIEKRQKPRAEGKGRVRLDEESVTIEQQARGMAVRRRDLTKEGSR